MSDAVAAPEPPGVQEAKMPRVRGETLAEWPSDLYIPPDALEVFLEAFEGPLDLLLYLIRRQNLDILDIPVLRITQQYMEYIGLMRQLRWELAAEYLVMAAWLAEIKSRILLPRPPAAEEDLGDPRMELVRRLQEYERFKSAAEALEAQPRVGREIFVAQARPERVASDIRPPPAPGVRELLLAFREVLLRAELFTRHSISREPLSVRERMSRILELARNGPVRFEDVVDFAEGRAGVVICLLAVLELVKGWMLELSQAEPFASLCLSLAGAHAKLTDAAADARS